MKKGRQSMKKERGRKQGMSVSEVSQESEVKEEKEGEKNL